MDKVLVQGGDIINHDGTGVNIYNIYIIHNIYNIYIQGESIYGPKFTDENFMRRHACAGLLSMGNHGRHTNSSQFFITLKACPHLDGKNVVFGQVVSGMEIVRKIGEIPSDVNDHPMIPITIFGSGQIDDTRKHLRDHFLHSMSGFKPVGGNVPQQPKAEIVLKPLTVNKEEESEDNLDSDSEEEELQINTQQFAKEKLNKYFDLRLKMNEARKLNNKAVIEENQRLTDPQYERKKRKKEWEEEFKEEVTSLEQKGLDANKMYLLDPASVSRRQKKKKKLVFGWDGIYIYIYIYNSYSFQ